MVQDNYSYIYLDVKEQEVFEHLYIEYYNFEAESIEEVNKYEMVIINVNND